MAVNWFVALNGKVTRGQSVEEVWASMLDRQGEEWIANRREKLELKAEAYRKRHPKLWSATSSNVLDIIGYGDTAEEAIRDFEEKMRLP